MVLSNAGKDRGVAAESKIQRHSGQFAKKSTFLSDRERFTAE